MTAMGVTKAVRQAEKHHKETLASLERWRELFLQAKAGVAETHPDAIRLELNALLDEWIDHMGIRGRDPGIWDRDWVPSWPLKRMSKET